jgi:hypothetical protein
MGTLICIRFNVETHLKYGLLMIKARGSKNGKKSKNNKTLFFFGFLPPLLSSSVESSEKMSAA